TIFAHQLRQNRAHASAVHLLVQLVGEIFIRSIREGATTSAPQRRGRHTSAGTTRTLLAPRLLGGVSNFLTILLLAVAAASVGLVSHNHLMDQRFIVIATKNGIRRSHIGCR